MIEKKSSKGDLEKNKTTFFLIGLVVVTGLVYACFELFAVSEYAQYVYLSGSDECFVELNEEIIPTDHTSATKQVIKNEGVILNLVNDNINIHTVFDFSKEFSLDEMVEDYLPVEITGEEIDHIYSMRFVEELPEPSGGFDALYAFLYSNIKYPEIARKKGIAGKVLIEFVVERDGSVSNVKLISGVHPELDQEALRVVKIVPKWKPGKHSGKNVRTNYIIPIQFNIK
jgi:protein TonB